ncbi:MAG TPA: hypothetical protein VN361_08860, partial [Oxalicibacterium sp.]|nr:hypothetical protein [Oxalicibacterium sp.]
MATILALLLGGCAANVKLPASDKNPPPAEVFANFSDFELKPMDRGSDCVQERGGDIALTLVQAKLRVKIGKLIENWKASPAPNAPQRKLLIEPSCANARYVGKGARFGLGVLAGDSVLVLNLRYVDASTGKVIASPVFYQRANTFGGTYSLGATDRDMLERMASLIAIYTASNYDKAVGGPTG